MCARVAGFSCEFTLFEFWNEETPHDVVAIFAEVLYRERMSCFVVSDGTRIRSAFLMVLPRRSL